MRAQQRTPWRTTFDPTREFVVRRQITLGAVTYLPGMDFPKTEVPLRRLRQLYDQRVIQYPGERPGARLDRPDPLTASAGVAGDAFTERRDVLVPGDWAELPWPKRRALAALLTDQPVKSAADAAAAISAELERRAAGV